MDKNNEVQVESQSVLVKPKGLAALRERVKGRHADTYSDDMTDDDVVDQGMSDYDEMSGLVDEYKKRDGAFDELAMQHPEGMAFLNELAKGTPLRDAIEIATGTSFDELYNDPNYPKSKEEKAKARQAETDAMMDKLLDDAKAQGMSDEDVDEALGVIDDFIDACTKNAVTVDLLKMALGAKRHDADVEQAKRDGEVAGRNMKAEEMQKKAKKRTDGMPHLAGMSRGANEQNAVMSRGGRTGVGQDIWNSANMKRTEYQ